jgi:small conductance mechanosensitive channel
MKWDWQKFYDRAYNWVLNIGPRVIVAITILIIGMWLIKLLNKWFKRSFDRRRFNPTLRYFFQNLIAITLQVFLIMLVLEVIGVQLTFLSAMIAGLTVAAGLALSGTFQNFVGGILILFLRPYRVGDNISVQGNEGTVTSIQLFFTTVVTFDNKTIIIPNGQLSNNVIINLSLEGKRRLDIELKFNYSTDIAQVKKILEDSIQTAKQILPEPVARIGVSTLEAERYTITVNVWINAHGFYDTRLELQEKLVNDVKAAGIKFPGM